MGHPKRRRKAYVKPRGPWETKRIEEEKALMGKYGLKNKREIWKAASVIKKYRREVRRIFAERAGGKAAEQALSEKEAILDSLKRKGILEENAKIENVQALDLEDILERRLQTIVYKSGMSNSIKQARQLIVHGHIAVKGQKITAPSYTVEREEEKEIGYYGGTSSFFITAKKKG